MKGIGFLAFPLAALMLLASGCASGASSTAPQVQAPTSIAPQKTRIIAVATTPLTTLNNGQVIALAPTLDFPPGSLTVYQRCLTDIAQKNGISSWGGSEEIVSVETTEFADTSLGVPQTGQTFVQQVTPGFIFLIKFKGTLYEYHADKASNIVFAGSSPVQ